MSHIKKPIQGSKITWDASQQKWAIPNDPIICFIEGDGIGQDITPVVRNVLNAAVRKAYGDSRCLHWMELYAGEKAVQVYGEGVYLPEETLDALREYMIGLKGPLTTPVGGGMRSLNVSIRKSLDLYSIVRPIRFFQGCRSPLRHPEKTKMVIFREATEDVYAGIEWESNTPDAIKVMDFLEKEMSIHSFRNKEYGIGIKYISKFGSERIMRRAVEYAFLNNCESITLVHKGNIMKYTEGAFRNWCYRIAQEEYGAKEVDGVMKISNNGKEVIVKDVIADNFLQQILLKPEEYSLILTMNLNGDYISDALAAQVGGLGFAPGANIGDQCAVFEATHGTAPKSAGLNKANPSSLLLSGEMMLRQMSWHEPANLIISAIEKTLKEGIFTYDLTKGTSLTPVSTSSYGNALIKNLSE